MGFELGIIMGILMGGLLCFKSRGTLPFMAHTPRCRIAGIYNQMGPCFFFREGEARVCGGLGLRIEVRGNTETLEYP